MTYGLMSDLQNVFNGETEKEIFFYTPTYYCFDNFSAFEVSIWGRVFPTAEHAYQWKKYEQKYPAIADEIYDATSPNAVKNISDAYKQEVSEEFLKNKLKIMKEILLAKVSQHEKVKKMLILSTGKTIIENSLTDNYWGIGDSNGENHLGRIWMEIRGELS